MAIAAAMQTKRDEMLFETRRSEYPSSLSFMIFSLFLDEVFSSHSNFSVVPQRSHAPGNPTAGFSLRPGFETRRLPAAVFTFRFFVAL